MEHESGGPRRMPLHTFRGEIMQAAQRRDMSALRNIVSTLVHHHRLDAPQLNACLVLHHVVWTGELNEIAEFLLQLGCDPMFPDINGDTAFHYCVRGCNIKFLKHFHQMFGSRIFEALNNNHFNLLLTAAAESSDEKAYEILNILEWLYLSGISMESLDANGKTGLMWACQRGSLTVVQWFLSRGANLAHRDHNGRTVIMMACLSGDEETVRTVCEKGAINLLDCESNDDRESNTALKLCWNKGHFFLGLSLRQWNFQKKTFGCMRVFKNVYAWYYWTLMAMNFFIFLAMSATLIERKYDYWYYCFAFLVMFVISQFFWILAFASDPGYVKSPIIPDQSRRCTQSLKHDLSQRPVFSFRVTSACYKLQLLEREANKISAELTALNRHYGVRSAHSTQLPPDGERKFEYYVNKIREYRDQMLSLLDKVGNERRLACPPGYAKQVMEGSPRRVCLTCRIVKPFRAHHCGDCAHCVHRFDHHCIWVDNCIGQGNQRSFLMFLFTLTVSIFYLWVLVGIYYTEEIVGNEEPSLDVLAQPLFYIALFNSLLNLLWGGFVGYLFGRTFKSMLTNITFYEYLKKPSHIHKRFHGKIHQCCWDLGDLTIFKVLRNIYMFCSGKNRWDVNDYPEYADEETEVRRTAVEQPMLRGRRTTEGIHGVLEKGNDDDQHRRGGHFERRPPTETSSRRHQQPYYSRGTRGSAGDAEIELGRGGRYQRIGEPMEYIEPEIHTDDVDSDKEQLSSMFMARYMETQLNNDPTSLSTLKSLKESLNKSKHLNAQLQQSLYNQETQSMFPIKKDLAVTSSTTSQESSHYSNIPKTSSIGEDSNLIARSTDSGVQRNTLIG